MPITHIITDIEGTTTDIAFVHNVLFPYASQHLHSFVIANANSSEVRAHLADVSKETGRPLSDSEAVAQLLRWIKEDKKIGPLKALQGLIWEQGYRNGELKGHVYDDAAYWLKQWQQQDIALQVYSSGSVKAQQLIYGHSNHGDLRPLFSGYFDTRIGQKREQQSYSVICDALGGDANSMLFLSDVTEELDAAKTAGLQTAWITRNDQDTSQAKHPHFKDFNQLANKLSA